MDETDDALLTSGDLEDFGRFYDRHARTLLGFFQRRTGNPEVAADLTAETFAAALVARSRYWDPKNESYNFFRVSRGGKITQVAGDPLLGVIKTVIKVKKIPKRMTKADFQ